MSISSKVSARVSPAGPRLDFASSPSRVAELADELIASTKQLYDSIAAVTDPTAANVLGPLQQHAYESYLANTNIEFLQHVHPDKAVRDASTEADKKLSEFFVTQEMRTDVYATVQKLAEKVSAGESADAAFSDPQTRRFLDRLVRDGRRSGLHLPAEQRSELEALKKRISEISIAFNKNISEENTIFEFSEAELAGVDESVLANLPRSCPDTTPDQPAGNTGKYLVSLKYPDYRPVMRKCSVRATRQILERAFNSRCQEMNTPLLAELVTLRKQEAQILNFPSHADFISEVRLAKSAENIRSFIDSLHSKVTDSGAATRELAQILAARQAHTGESPEIPLLPADLAFYRNLVMETKYAVDQAEFQQYFPVDHVTKEMLGVYEELLGLRFVEVHGDAMPAGVWHPEVQCFAVYDGSNSTTGAEGSAEKLLGHFYLDLFPREGKYSHAALFPLAPSCEYLGERTPAVCALVCNFTKKPALLTHDEVTTYFHEFGHCMHHMCAEQAKYARFAGTSVERDFVECPSQMLENWCWEEAILKRLSKHVDTGNTLSEEMIGKLVNARNADEGMHVLQQLSYASFDQAIHGQDARADVAQVYAEMQKKFVGMQVTDNTCMPASFGHMVGYSASYIGYLWAEVYAADAFMSKFKGKLLDKAVGTEYREKILGPGGSQDGEVMIENFLARKPNMDNFLKLKGM